MKTCFSIFAIFISITLNAQDFSGKYLDPDFYRTSEYQKLRTQIIELSEMYYEAYELSDVKTLDSILHKDYQYLHDLGGFYHSKEKILVLRENNFKQNPITGRGHKAIPGTIKVSPLSTHGAVLTQRVIYNNTRFRDGAIYELGTVDHIFEFIIKDNKWQIIRLYSIDHHPDFNGNQAKRRPTLLKENTLDKLLGTYRMSDDVDCIIEKNNGSLTATFVAGLDKQTINLNAENDSTFFEISKWTDWAYKFHKSKNGLMKLSILLNNNLYSTGERIKN